MYKWIQPGQFTLEIPENWSVLEELNITELKPDLNNAAIHISVLKKAISSRPYLEEAIYLVEEFALNNKLGNGDMRCKMEPIEGSESFSMYAANFLRTGFPDEPLIWVVKSIVGESKAVLATLCLDDVKTKSYVEGLAILDSLISI